MRKLILTPKNCKRIENGYLETYPITIHKNSYFFDSDNPDAVPCYIGTSTGKVKNLFEIKTFEDFEKYVIDYEVCGSVIVVISKSKHCYIFAKNGDFTTLSADTSSTFTSGKIRIFITETRELIFRVEESNRIYMINPDKAL